MSFCDYTSRHLRHKSVSMSMWAVTYRDRSTFHDQLFVKISKCSVSYFTDVHPVENSIYCDNIPGTFIALAGICYWFHECHLHNLADGDNCRNSLTSSSSSVKGEPTLCLYTSRTPVEQLHDKPLMNAIEERIVELRNTNIVCVNELIAHYARGITWRE